TRALCGSLREWVCQVTRSRYKYRIVSPVKVFVAGASGVIGRRLVPMLVQAGHEVSGMTRSADRAEILRALGAEPVVCDVFDADALRAALERARPEVVVHELTDLPQNIDPRK